MSNHLSYAAKHKLVALVKARPHLWDTKHPEYNRGDLKRTAWVEMHKEMVDFGCDLTENDLRYAWKSLRDVHRRMVKNDAIGKKRPRAWPFLDTMSYLIPSMTSKEPLRAIEVTTASLDELRKLEEIGGASPQAISNRILEMVHDSMKEKEIKREAEEKERKQQMTIIMQEKVPSPPAKAMPQSVGKRSASLVEAVKNAEPAEPAAKPSRSNGNGTDKFDNFGAYIASSLRDLDPINASTLMKEINNLLLDYSCLEA